MSFYTVPKSPPPLSQVDSVTAWPGGVFPLSLKKGGRRTKRNNKKSKRKNKKSRRCWS